MKSLIILVCTFIMLVDLGSSAPAISQERETATAVNQGLQIDQLLNQLLRPVNTESTNFPSTPSEIFDFYRQFIPTADKERETATAVNQGLQIDQLLNQLLRPVNAESTNFPSTPSEIFDFYRQFIPTADKQSAFDIDSYFDNINKYLNGGYKKAEEQGTVNSYLDNLEKYLNSIEYNTVDEQQSALDSYFDNIQKYLDSIDFNNKLAKSQTNWPFYYPQKTDQETGKQQVIDWSFNFPQQKDQQTGKQQGIGWSVNFPQQKDQQTGKQQGIGWSVNFPQQKDQQTGKQQGFGWSVNFPQQKDQQVAKEKVSKMVKAQNDFWRSVGAGALRGAADALGR